MARSERDRLNTAFEGLAFVIELLEAGKIMPVIDRRYTLPEVPEALRYLGEGHSKGKLVIAVEHGDNAGRN